MFALVLALVMRAAGPKSAMRCIRHSRVHCTSASCAAAVRWQRDPLPRYALFVCTSAVSCA